MPDLASTKLVDLNVLDDHEALKLFVKVVGEERAAAEPEATAELLDACAGLPLAIRICAARLVTRSGWTIRAMAGRLTDEHRRLDEMRAGDLAVRASFEVSFTSLPPSTDKQGIDPARAFRLLGLWQGPSISAAAAAALFGVPEYSAEDALEVLVDTHLLESVATDRYRFHDLLRVYAAGRAEDDEPAAERDAAITRLLTWYMRTADAAAAAVSPHRYNIVLDPAGTDPPPLAFAGVDDALAWYDSERANLVAATRQAAGSGLDEVAWRLPAPLFTMFNRRGNWADCIATHRVALESARRAGHRPGEAWVLNNLGEALGFTRETEGIAHLEQALMIRRETGDHKGEAQTANNLADAYVILGRKDEALDLLRRALELNRETGNRYGEGVALNNLGEAFLDLGRTEEAIDCFHRANRTFAEIKVPHGVGYALHNVGRCYLSLGRDAEALEHLQQALAVHRATGDRHREAFTLRFLGVAQSRAARPAEAEASWTQAAAIFDALGDHAQADEIRTGQAESGIS
jgi:tetratricopeptide (TPR) repeat protein